MFLRPISKELSIRTLLNGFVFHKLGEVGIVGKLAKSLLGSSVIQSPRNKRE